MIRPMRNRGGGVPLILAHSDAWCTGGGVPSGALSGAIRFTALKSGRCMAF